MRVVGIITARNNMRVVGTARKNMRVVGIMRYLNGQDRRQHPSIRKPRPPGGAEDDHGVRRLDRDLGSSIYFSSFYFIGKGRDYS